jgi:tRNA (mo5U34)-methyltransferase
VEWRERAEAIEWYHSIEIKPGVVTDGVFDLRDQMHHYGLPERLDGQRALDVGSLNGFWAFEMERRGASEVVSLDVEDERRLDWPPRRRTEIEAPLGDEGLRLGRGLPGFELAREALGSNVQRVERSIYEAVAEDLGMFDIVFCGSVLMHLRDQLLALERIANLCSGLFVSAEEYDPLVGPIPFPVTRYLADRPKSVVFWLPGVRTWQRMIWSAGFDRVVRHGRFRLRSTRGWSVRHVVHHAWKQD